MPKLSNAELFNAYVNRTYATASNATGSLWYANRLDHCVLYSYGIHWPLAIRMPDGTYRVNGDRYSVTTSKHRSGLISALARAQSGRYEVEWQWSDVFTSLPLVDMIALDRSI